MSDSLQCILCMLEAMLLTQKFLSLCTDDSTPVQTSPVSGMAATAPNASKPAMRASFPLVAYGDDSDSDTEQ